MFEFDEHYDELLAMQAEAAISGYEDSHLLPSWSYVGNEVWKLDFVADPFEIVQEWHLEAVDVV